MPHICPIENCSSFVPADKLLCYFHWRLVPATLKREVYAAWNNGRPHPDHAACCAAAVAAVSARLDLVRGTGLPL